MSAFIVSDACINRVVAHIADAQVNDYARRVLAQDVGIVVNLTDGPQRLASAMFSLNVEAVRQRYPGETGEAFRPLNFQHRHELCSTMQAYKSLACWLYQCAEGNVPETPLYRAMQRVKWSIADHIICELPAYNKAEWD